MLVALTRDASAALSARSGTLPAHPTPDDPVIHTHRAQTLKDGLDLLAMQGRGDELMPESTTVVKKRPAHANPASSSGKRTRAAAPEACDYVR